MTKLRWITQITLAGLLVSMTPTASAQEKLTPIKLAEGG